MEINSIHFVTNKNIVLPESELALHHLANQILINSSFCFEIQGHVNAPKVDAKEVDRFMELSIARAGYIYNYFVKKGIDKKRMIAKGYGHLHMIYPNAKTTKEMTANKRVEIKVYSCNNIKAMRESFKEEAYITASKISYYSKE